MSQSELFEEVLERVPKDFRHIPDDVKRFARAEGLVGEEDALLLIPAREQHARLRAIADELDRVYETLRARAAKRTAPHGP